MGSLSNKENGPAVLSSKCNGNDDLTIEMADINLQKQKQGVTSDKQQDYRLVPVPPDGGYGWIIVMCGAALSFIATGGLVSFGIYLVEFVEYFHVKKGYASWIGSIMMSIIAPMGPLLPLLLNRYGSRVTAMIGSIGLCVSYILTSLAPNVPFLFFSMGLLTGIFSCMVYISGQVIVQNYFHKRRALASSLSILGTALAMFIWPPFTRVLIDQYSWRGACILIGGINLHGVIFGALLRPPPLKKVPKNLKSNTDCNNVEEKQSHFGKYSCQTVVRKYSTRFLMFWGWFCTNSGHILMVTFTPIRADSLGLEKTQGAFLVSTLGVVSGIVRVGAGWVGDRPCVIRNLLAGGASVYCGLLTLISLSFRTFPTMIMYSILYGLGGACYIGLQGACVYDVVGLKNISYGFSILFVALGTSCFASLPIAGTLYDDTKRPLETVLTFGIVQVVGGICLVLIPFVQKYFKKITEEPKCVQS